MAKAKTTRPLQPIVVDYQNLFESLPGQYLAFLPDDPDFTMGAETAEHAALAMVTRGQVIGKPVFDVFPDTSEKYLKTGVSDLKDSLRKVIRTGKADTMDTLQYDLPRPDGTMETRFWRLIHSPLFDAAGKLVLIIQSTNDITDEIVADTKLQRTQRQLDEALSVGMIGTWVWDIQRNKVVGDKNTAAMFGTTPAAAAAGLPLSVFVGAMHVDDRPRVEGEIAAVLKSGDHFYSEYRTIADGGVVRWLVVRGRVERDDSGTPTNFQGVILDITERKIVENNLSYLAQASAVLSASLDYKKTLQSIAELMVPDIADWCTVDILGRDGQLQLVALAHKDPAKVKWAHALRKQQGPVNLDEPSGVAQVLRSGQPEFYPDISDELLVASAKDETELKLLRELALSSVIVVPLKIHNKTVGAISLISTGHKRQYTQSDLEMAEELASRASLAMTNASLYDELEQRVEERTAALEITNLSLQRSNQELQDFAYVASHDLQEPLRKIQAFGNLLETEYGEHLGEGSDYLRRMRSAAARMSALIEDILSFSRVTTKGRSFTQVNLKTVAQEVASDLEIRISDTGARLEIGDLPIISADAMQMRQLLQNLIANAIKFHREGVPPVITIRASSEKVATATGTKSSSIKYCRLEIEDNGLGFEEKYLDRIFAVFQRLHNRDSYEGTGIGLAVCRKIVERHGGHITARSTPGQGSTFIIDLPIRHKKGENLL